jgi:cyclic pyranopterin phosphate synthase
MPENMQFLERKALLSYEEILRLMQVLTGAGINKVRITGGEPFLRKDLMLLLAQLAPIASVSITTNGVLTAPFIPALKTLGIRQINLSLDTLQAPRFFQITRRDQFSAVKQTLDSLLAHEMDVKINMVVMDGVNTDELLDFAALTRDHALSVRFIEEMPFNGQGNNFSGISWNYLRILDTIRTHYPIEKIADAPNSTSLNYHIPHHKGSIGVIPAYSRTFCGSCNRIRVTPTGGLKTCLYGDDVLNVKTLFREGMKNEELLERLQSVLQQRAIDGFEAAALNTHAHLESMSVIGG